MEGQTSKVQKAFAKVIKAASVAGGWIRQHAPVLTVLALIVAGLWTLHSAALDRATKTADDLKADAQTKLAAANDSLAVAESTIADLNKSLENVRRDLAVAESENRSLVERSGDSARRLSTAKNELSELRENYEELTERIDKFRSDLSKEREKSRERLSDLLTARERLNTLSYQVVILRNQIAAYQSVLSEQVEDDYSKKIRRLNDGLQLFHLVRWPIRIDGWTIDASYIIMRRVDLLDDQLPYGLVAFEPHEYVLKEAFQCLDHTELCADICSLIDEAATRYAGEASREYKRILSRIGTKEDGKTYEQAIVAELGAIFRSIKTVDNRTHLLLRGLADGQPSGWSRPLSAEYRIDRIPYFGVDQQACRTSNLDCWEFSDREVQTITDEYSHTELPNLRASYLKENITSVLRGCSSGAGASDVGLLNGIDDLRLSEAASADVKTVIGIIVIGENVRRN